MATETLKLQITADNAAAVASLNQLTQELKTFEKDFKNAFNDKDALRLGKAIEETKKKMEVLNAQINPFQKITVGSNQAAQALTNVGRVAQDLPFGFMGIQNNLNPLLESFQRLKAETGSTGGALKALGSSLIGAGGIGLALSVASSAFLLFGDRLFDSGKKAQEAKKEFDGITASIAKDAATVTALVEKYKDSNLTLGQRKTILDELNRVSPEYFSGLDKENLTYQQLTKASDAYIASLTKQIQLKVLQAQYEKNIDKLLQNQVENEKVKKIQADFAARNKTGQEAVGLPTNAKLERENKLLLDQIASLMKIEALKTKDKQAVQGTNGPAAIRAIQVKVDYRPQQELAVNEALRERLQLITAIANEVQRQEAAQQKKDFLIAGGVTPKKTEVLANFDQEQMANQQMLLGIEQSRIAALDEINKKFKEQVALGENIANVFVNTLANIAAAPDPFQAIGDSIKRLIIDLSAAVAKMLIIRAIMTAINPAAGAAKGIGGLLGGIIGGVTPFATGGIVTGPTMGLVGEAGSEAIIPLDRFQQMQDRAFGMGAMMGGASGGGGVQGGEFVLRGNDMVLLLQRAGYSLNLRR